MKSFLDCYHIRPHFEIVNAFIISLKVCQLIFLAVEALNGF